MAASDSTTAFSQVDGAAVFSDGTATPNTLTVGFVQADVAWTVEGAPYTEARVRNKHHSTPVLRKTGDGNVTGSMSLLVTSLKGDTAVTPYEFLTRTGGASAYKSTANGDKYAIKIAVTFNATDAGGASQTVTFAYVVPTSIKVDPAGGDGLMMLSFDFTDHENAPTVA